MQEVYLSRSRVPNFREWWLPEQSLVAKMERVFCAAKLNELIRKNETIGIKLHLGEPGNTSYIRPIFVSRIVEIVKRLGGTPVIVETSGLGYIPGRTSAEKHILAARRNGFAKATVGAEIVMLDGVHGLDGIKVGEVFVARGIKELDALIVLSHTTGHLQAGFGGAVKNLGLGCVTKTSKFRVHYQGKPRVKREKCTSCLRCVELCPVKAIKRKPIEIIPSRCACCNVCLDVCPSKAIEVRETSGEELARRIAENAFAVVKTVGKENVACINLAIDITPHCDCHPSSDVAIVSDIGVLASRDSVAIDTASVNLINAAVGIAGSEAESAGALAKGSDKFKLIHPLANWRLQLEHAEKLGMGEMGYTLKEVV